MCCVCVTYQVKDSCVPVKIVITTVLIKPWEEGVIRFVKYCSLCGVLCVTALDEYAILHWKRQHTETFVNVAVETTVPIYRRFAAAQV